jgi:hypothetical protein
MTAAIVSLCTVLILVAGCRTLGPRTVAGDRVAFSEAMSDSWKRQMLLNIVKARYVEPPTFMEVGQIVAGYTLESSISVGGTVSRINGDGFNIGGSASFTDRPTITYVPMTGDRYIQSLTAPLPADAVLMTIQAGWPADAIMMSSVAVINGLENERASISGVTPPSANFRKVIELMRRLQLSKSIGMRAIRDEKNKKQTTLLTFATPFATDEAKADGAELLRLLRLNAKTNSFRVVFGATAANDLELAVQTRSPLQILSILAAQTDVPTEDVADGRATPGSDLVHPPNGETSLIHIHSSTSKPKDALVAVHYRDMWFFIEDRDLKSKRMFAYLELLFSIGGGSQKENLPLLTIPTG